MHANQTAVPAGRADVAWPQMIWPVPSGIELSGATVRLAELDPEADAAELFAALDHDQVWQHVSGRPASPAAYRDVLEARAQQPSWHQWTVRDRDTGAVVGTSSYLEASAVDARIEIGATAYAPPVWGTLVNPETKLLLLGLAFETMRAGRVQLKTDVRNLRSRQAIARLGARYEGTLRRYQRRADGTIRDTALFSITAEDWPTVQARLRARLGSADSA